MLEKNATVLGSSTNLAGERILSCRIIFPAIAFKIFTSPVFLVIPDTWLSIMHWWTKEIHHANTFFEKHQMPTIILLLLNCKPGNIKSYICGEKTAQIRINLFDLSK